jgi:hypothetical protein
LRGLPAAPMINPAFFFAIGSLLEVGRGPPARVKHLPVF